MSLQLAILLLTFAGWLFPTPATEVPSPKGKGAEREVRERRRSRVASSTYSPSILLSKPPRAISTASTSSPTSPASPSLPLPIPLPSDAIPFPPTGPPHPTTARPTPRVRSVSTNSNLSNWTTTSSRRSSNASTASRHFLPGVSSSAAPLLTTSEPVVGSSPRTASSPASVASLEKEEAWGSLEGVGTFSVSKAIVASTASGPKEEGRRIFSLPSKLKKKHVAGGQGVSGNETESKEPGGSTTADRLKRFLSRN